MAKYHQNRVESLIFDSCNAGNFRLCSSFSSASFCRSKLFVTTRRRREFDISCHHHVEDPNVRSPKQKHGKRSEPKKKRGSKMLSDLFNYSEALEISVEELKAVVKRLQFNQGSQKIEAALDVRRLTKENSEARETLSLLGAIPPLSGMLDSINLDLQIASLYALLNLGIGNNMNKAAIVKAGALHKMLKLIESPNPSVSEVVIANFLSLSALDSNKPIIGSSGAISFLVKTLVNVDKRRICSQTKHDCLRAIYNLSIFPSNISQILETDLLPFLLSNLGDMEVSDRILSILCNIVSTSEGRKSISNSTDSFSILIDVLSWIDSPICQEKASYILMVMVYKVHGDRQAMIEAGIVSPLLELMLVGNTLAQKRASKILECLRVYKGKQIMENNGDGVISAPICESIGMNRDLKKQGLDLGLEEEEMMSEEKKAVKQLVQESLQNNMNRMVKRANYFIPSHHFNSLTATSWKSKSLPF